MAKLCQIFSSNVCIDEFDPFHFISTQYIIHIAFDMIFTRCHRISKSTEITIIFLLFTLSVGEQLDEFIFLNNFVGIRVPYHSLPTTVKYVAHDKPNVHAFFSPSFNFLFSTFTFRTSDFEMCL